MNDRMDLLQAANLAASGAAGATSASLTVPAGERWKLQHAYSQFTGAGPHNIHYTITRLGNERILADPVSTGSGVRNQFYTNVPTIDSWILQATDVLKVVIDAIDAGGVLSLYVIVEKRIGETL